MTEPIAHAPHRNRLYYTVWVGLLVLTIVEVILAYRHLSVTVMLIILMGLSFLKAGLIVAYFMHLRFERFSLFMTLIPATVFCILMFVIFFPDSLRLLDLRP